ncbi:nuclear pore membrane glycoprotein 210-like [Danio rerio]|uniref:Nuclear pore membrane glycoprotein 210-like n=1 Tax=Danio rerio TaxID=7955 RepID=A0AC58HI47_DANRE
MKGKTFAKATLYRNLSEVLLSVGSYSVVIFDGGPLHWSLAPLHFYRDVKMLPEGGVYVETLSLTEAKTTQHAYQVTCIAVGGQVGSPNQKSIAMEEGLLSFMLSMFSPRDATLQLAVFDQMRVQFDHFTSCSMRWTSSDPGL